MVAIAVWALAFTSVVVQDPWACAIRWWAHAPASLWVDDQIPMALYVWWTLTATREDVKYFMVVLFAFTKSVIKVLLGNPSVTRTLACLWIKRIAC